MGGRKEGGGRGVGRRADAQAGPRAAAAPPTQPSSAHRAPDAAACPRDDGHLAQQVAARLKGAAAVLVPRGSGGAAGGIGAAGGGGAAARCCSCRLARDGLRCALQAVLARPKVRCQAGEPPCRCLRVHVRGRACDAAGGSAQGRDSTGRVCRGERGPPIGSERAHSTQCSLFFSLACPAPRHWITGNTLQRWCVVGQQQQPRRRPSCNKPSGRSPVRARLRLPARLAA